MQKNSSALRNFCLSLLFIAVLFAAGKAIFAQEPSPVDSSSVNAGGVLWYRSNSSGMALELIPSRLAATRNEYSLSVERLGSDRLPWSLPRLLRPYFEESYRVELRLLHEYGKETRRQWIFRDSGATTRLVASGTAEFFAGESSGRENTGDDGGTKKQSRSGFIEIRNSQGIVTRELQFDEDLAEWDFRYTYREGVLLRTETWFKEAPPPPVSAAVEKFSEEEDSNEADAEEAPSTPPPPPPIERKEPVFVRAYTDTYRYTRSGSIRAIDRTVHAGGERLRVGFPRLGPGIPMQQEITTHGGAYTAAFFVSAYAPEGAAISYTLDNRGRILGEVWKDENGKVIGELTNNWSGDRLQTVSWKAGGETRLIEFEYNRSGNPTKERNFRNGVLERSVTIEGDNETEEIYMNGRLILRAYWENGIKIKEERNPSRGSTQ